MKNESGKTMYLVFGWDNDGEQLLSLQNTLAKAIQAIEEINNNPDYDEFGDSLYVHKWEVGEIREPWSGENREKDRLCSLTSST